MFVDCGAYVGDTVEQYIWHHEGIVGKIYAFEPNARNIKALNARFRRLNEEWAFDDGKLNIVDSGVGRKTEMQYFAYKTFGSLVVGSSDASVETVKVFALDDYFGEQRISFLKSDVESFDYEMLRGAERIICRDRPKLAICIYHNAFDMFRTQLWLDGLGLGYKFAVRHHSVNIAETVLYAWQ